MEQFQLLLAALILWVPLRNLDKRQSWDPSFDSLVKLTDLAILCDFERLMSLEYYGNFLNSIKARQFLMQYDGTGDLKSVLSSYLHCIVSEIKAHYTESQSSSVHLQVLAICFLQHFVQLNFTGPPLSTCYSDLLFPDFPKDELQKSLVKLLNIEGARAYDLVTEPLILILACLLLEIVSNVDDKFSLVGISLDVSVASLNVYTIQQLQEGKQDPISCCSRWWRSRAIQVHNSILSESSGLLMTTLSLLLDSKLVGTIVPSATCDSELERHLEVLYNIECARTGIHSHTEHLSIPFLKKARSLCDLRLVLTGAKAKRTKFQKFHTSMLVLLAQSMRSALYDDMRNAKQPEGFQLNSDLLLERPVFETLNDEQVPQESESKRLRLDMENENSCSAIENLIPRTLNSRDIPETLRRLDPNNQPALNDIDNLHLLLCFTILKQTSPSHDVIVDEELLAILGRILYAEHRHVNWAIFSRALWERSVLETSKARTVERGILQMTSLVEEIGIKIKSRIIPQGSDVMGIDSVSQRLQFFHQLPLLPQWHLDIQLADKYMSLGVLRSAVEIYNRLQLVCEAALCYASVDNEQEAKRILMERIALRPDDVRAISILGDITKNPALWTKAWDIGRYPKAKASLARYYYSPPSWTNLKKDLDVAIKHMHESLAVNPLSYENWFFYGCCGLELGQYELASESFTRCVSLDETNCHAWSNLATSLLRLDKLRPAFNALQKAIRLEVNGKRSWRIYENYCLVALKLGEWNDVIVAVGELIDIKSANSGQMLVDIPVLEKLVEILVSTCYPQNSSDRLTHFQSLCINLVCEKVPTVLTDSARFWRLIARVELWRKRPWAALDCHEKAYRAISNKHALEPDETVWNEAVEACDDLIAAYESLGKLPGKHNAQDVVCSDWRFKSRTTVQSLMSKGKAFWEDSPGWERLTRIKKSLTL